RPGGTNSGSKAVNYTIAERGLRPACGIDPEAHECSFVLVRGGERCCVSAESISEMSAEQLRASTKAVRREQVWAAMIRAVDFLLAEAETGLEGDYHRAMSSDDQERLARLSRRLQMVQSLRQQVEASPERGG